MATFQTPERDVTPPPRPPSDDAEQLAALSTIGSGPARARRAIPEPTMLNSHGPAKVLALCNQKGGVGKTTSTINLGAALTEYGRRVLLVDFDPQGALSVGLGIPAHQLQQTIYNVLIERSVGIHDVVIPTGVEGM